MPLAARFTLLLLSLGATSAAVAATATDSQVCGYRIEADVKVEANGDVQINDDHGRVLISGDRLSIDHLSAPLDPDQRARLDLYRGRLVALIPAIADAARESLRARLLSTLSAAGALADPDRLPPEERDRLVGIEQRIAAHWSDNQLPLRNPDDAQLDRDLDALASISARFAGQTATAPRNLPAPLAEPLQTRGAVDRPLRQHVDALCDAVATLDLLENSLGRFDVFDAQSPSI